MKWFSKLLFNNKTDKKVTILNTSILTTYGVYKYERISVEECKKLISSGFNSAVGHKATCEVLSSLLGVPVDYKRIEYFQDIKETVIVFKLKSRIDEGKVLTLKEINEIGYEFGKLTRIK
jgi:hypothetical protein